MKKLFHYLSLFIFLFNCISASFLFSLDDMDWNESEEQASEYTAPRLPGTRSVDTVVAGILSTAITEPLWRSTAPVRSRNIVDILPAATLFKTDNDIAVHLFYSKDNQLPVGIENNFNITNQNYMTLLQSLFPGAVDDAAEILELFNTINVEQRHAGMLINSFCSFGNFNFSFTIPVALAERNFVTNPTTETRIQNILQQYFPEGPSIDKKREFARLKFGLGDIRINMGIKPIKGSFFDFSVGGSTIIPTAMGVSLDAKFKIPAENQFGFPGIDLTTLLNSARSNLLEPMLGNNGHASLGVYGETKFHLIPKMLFWKHHLYFDYIFSGEEKRLFMNRKKMSTSYVLQNGPTEAIADEYEREYLVPRELKVRVRPGNVLSYTTGLEYLWHYLNIGAGYNFYFREEENCESLLDNSININDLFIENALDKSLTQHQFFGEIAFRMYQNKMPVSLGIGAGYSLNSSKNNSLNSTPHTSSSWNIFTKLSWSF